MKGRDSQVGITINANGAGEAVLEDSGGDLLIYDCEKARNLILSAFNTHAARHATIKVYGALKMSTLTFTSADIVAEKRWKQIGVDLDLNALTTVLEWLDGEGYDYIAIAGISDADAATCDLGVGGVA
jgi:hypothetical protein